MIARAEERCLTIRRAGQSSARSDENDHEAFQGEHLSFFRHGEGRPRTPLEARKKHLVKSWTTLRTTARKVVITAEATYALYLALKGPVSSPLCFPHCQL